MVEIATIARRACGLAILALFVWGGSPVQAGPLDEMSVERWAKLREAERYQLNVAEKFYREKQYKVAADEYEKFLKLYDKSEGAPYAQLQWSHCQVEGRKLNAAIKDGYQSVLDYYPDSPDAPIAALLIGRTYRSMGDVKPAKQAYAKAIAAYPKHFASIMARFDLVEIAAKEMDVQTETAMLQDLTYNVERKGPSAEPCVQAARMLARLLFRSGNFDDGLKAFATASAEENVPAHLMNAGLGALPQIVSELSGSMDEAIKKKGEKLADSSSAWFKVQATNLLKDEKTKPRGIDAWYAAAEIRKSALQPDKQKAIYEDMLKALGTDDPLLSRIALWYKENKQMDQARLTYGKYKDVAEGQGQIAHSYFQENNFDKAAELYRKLAVTDVKAAPRWLTQAASSYRRGHKWDLAIAIYRELLVGDAANAGEYHFQIAETLFQGGRWSEAITAYRGTNRFPQVYQNMAQANRNLKKYDEAISLYTQLMVASPPNASWALYKIAETHEQAGKPEEAIKVYKQVCDKFPKFKEGSDAHSHLNQKYKIAVTLGGAKD